MNTLASIVPQLESGDEIIVTRLDCNWGHVARNLAMPRAAGTHLMFCDDDDSFVGDALLNVRRVLVSEPDRVHIFAMLQGEHKTVASDPPGCGTVGTPMIVVPNDPEKLGSWADVYEGDWWFLDSTLKKRNEEAIVHETPIARIGE